MRGYAHGGDLVTARSRFPGEILDFSANLNPLGMPEPVRLAARAAVEESVHYPDPLCRALAAGIARRDGTTPGQVLCGNGAADLIFRLAFSRRPGRALVTAPTFAEYECALAAVGCRTERFSLRQEEDFRLGEGFLEAIRPGVDLVFLCEPNNPTGLTTPRPLLERILARCQAAGALLVVDECFGGFLDRPEAHTLKGLLAPGGLLCLSMVESDLDDEPIPFLGSALRVSGYPRDELREVVTNAGLVIEDERVVTFEPKDPDARPEVQLFYTCRRGA